MVNLRRLSDRARNVVEKRGGVESLKEDAAELREIAKGKGSVKDKAKAAGKAIKDPGEKGRDRPAGRSGRTGPPGDRPEAGRARDAEQVALGGRASAPRRRRARGASTPPPAR
jgi:hypothetical protein